MTNGVHSDFIRISSSQTRYIDVHEPFSTAYRGWMSTKHVRDAADLIRSGCALKIEFGNCGTARTVDGFELTRFVRHGVSVRDPTAP